MKGPNIRIACCTFKNQRASAAILETRNNTSGGIWFSTKRLLRNLLSLIRTNDDLSKMWTSIFRLSQGAHMTTTSSQSAWGI